MRQQVPTQRREPPPHPAGGGGWLLLPAKRNGQSSAEDAENAEYFFLYGSVFAGYRRGRPFVFYSLV